MLCVDNYFTGRKDNIAASARQPAFRGDAPRRLPSRSTSRSTRSTISPARPRRSTTSSIRCRRPRPACIGAINMLGLAKRLQRQDLPGLDLRGLRRPDRASADRGLSRQRQPDRPARLLRRGQALRRDACSSTITASTSCASRWRASSTPTARACTRTTAAWCRTSSSRRLKGEPITLYGDGSQTRAFCYVDDLIEGFVRLMAAPDEVTGPINLGNPVETTGARAGRARSSR